METQLLSHDPLTIDIVESGVVSWEDLIRCVKTFHYGRNSNRNDFTSVWYEREGTCSSKHAFLKHVAELNKIDGVELILCLYKMTSQNTVKVGNVLDEFQLNYLPEGHCYIRFKDEAIDVTTMTSKFSSIQEDVIEEQIIQPDQVAEFKADYHQSFIKQWGLEHHPSRSFQELWEIREKCILALTV